jgi:hypothetical protein
MTCDKDVPVAAMAGELLGSAGPTSGGKGVSLTKVER